ncbi:MAG TPA: VanW family protein, partial [Chthoniobacteraceae bacterium]|nr:VanW family protein [Chthoniobacteraceae bacterium]
MTSPNPTDRQEPEQPTRAEALWFGFRALCFRARRGVENLKGTAPRRLALHPAEAAGKMIAESRASLFASVNPAEFALQAGKVHNLRLAARAVDGVRLKAGETFSFWAQVGRPIRRRGFVAGRELREGCIIPSIGGGLCQLSNSLYDAALSANFEIVERHAHSQRIPGSMSVTGRDATVFWNYVDLRFRAGFDWQIEARLTASELIVRIHQLSNRRLSVAPSLPSDDEDREEAESCETCGVTSCFRNSAAANLEKRGHTAWLVDAWQPEHDRYLTENRSAEDWLFTPLHSERWGIGPYRWSSAGFARVAECPLFVARRSWKSRRLAAQGSARQRTLLALDEELALSFARRLSPLAHHVVVSQNLLPFLWRNGVLGGRTFDVLITRLPLGDLESVLDRAATAHPESHTLADFRAPVEIVTAERLALAEARRWISPHRGIARLAGDRAELLDWHVPKRPAAVRGDTIVFPASTLGRKGAYELRDA